MDGKKAEFFDDGFKLEFEMENGSLVSSKKFETIQETRRWLFEHISEKTITNII